MFLLALACSGRTELADANNYAFSSEITTSSTPVAARTDLTVDWSGLSVDLVGEALDPAADITDLSIGVLDLTQDEVLETLVSGILLQSDVVAAASYTVEPGVTSALLSEFQFLATQVVPEENVLPDMGSWLLSANTAGVAGARMLTFFEPQDGGPVVPIELRSDSASLSYTVDLSAGEPATLDGWEVDWSGLTTDMRGLPLRLSDVDGLTLAHFNESLSTLEQDFLRLEQLSDVRYETTLTGVVRFDLGLLTDEDGQPFAGLSDEGVWLLALRCSLCSNPAPPFLTQLR